MKVTTRRRSTGGLGGEAEEIAARPVGALGQGLTVIFEPNHNGHRLYYVALLVRDCFSRGVTPVVLTSAEARTSVEWALHLGDSGELTVLEVPSSVADLKDLAGWVAPIRPSLTVIPDGDRFVRDVVRSGWSGTGRLSILVMRPDYVLAAPRVIAIPNGIARKIAVSIANWRRGVTVFALGSSVASRRGWPVRWVADPVTVAYSNDELSAVRERLLAENAACWFGVFGALTVRKNVDLVARALLGQRGAGLLLAGSLSAEAEEVCRPVLDRLRREGTPVVELAGPLRDSEFDAAIAAVDCVVAAHSNEGSSGVVGKAAVAGRLLLLAGARSLKRDARAVGDRAVWVALDESSLRLGVRKIMGRRPVEGVRQQNLESFVRIANLEGGVGA